MATRLLSFLTDIEQALFKESAANMGPTWEGMRMVNYKAGLARLTLTPPQGADPVAPGGTIFLQSFLLADNSLCLKASLAWDGATTTSLIAVYAKPSVDWKAEARQIATAWLNGAPAAATVESVPAPATLSKLSAAS